MNLFSQFLILQLFIIVSFSQSNIDSLKSILNKSLNDTNKVLLLSEIVALNSKIGKIIESDLLIEEMIKLSNNLDYKKGLALGYRHKGTLFLNTGKFQDALAEYKKANNIFIELNDFNGLAGTLNNIGLVYYREGAFNLALNYYLEVKKINDTKVKLAFIGPLLNNIGVLYQEIKDYNKALDYFQKALDDKNNSELNKASTLINIGDIYLFFKDYSKSIDYYQKAIIINEKYNNIDGLASCKFGLGNIYYHSNNYVKSIEYIYEALKIKKEIKNKLGVVECLNLLSKNYIKLNKLKLSEEKLKEAVVLAEEINYSYELINSYKIYSDLDSVKGNYLSSLNWFKKYKVLSDSLFNDRITKDIYKSEIKFEYDKKEEVLLKEKLATNEKLANQQKYIFIVIFILIIVFFILFWNYKQKRNKDKLNIILEEKIKERTKELIVALEKAEQTERMKTEFLAQMSHEIRTPLTNIINLAGLLISDFKVMDEDELKSVFNGISNGGKRIIRTIELILNYSQVMTNNYNLNFQELDLNILVENIISETKELAKNKDLEINYTNLLKNTINKYDEYSIWFILKNIIENAFIYTPSGNINIKLFSNQNQIIFECQDTGVGIVKEYLDKIFEPFIQEETGYTRSFDGVGLGLPLCKKYADLNAYSIKIESVKGEGTKVQVIIPKNID